VYKKVPVKSMHRPNATVYIVDGGAGDIEGTEFLYEKDTPWRAAQQEAIYTSYSRMHVSSTNFTYVHFDSRTRAVVDQFTLTK